MQDILMWGLNGVLGMFVTVLWSIISDLKNKIEKLNDECDTYQTNTQKEFADYKIDSAGRFMTREEMKHAIESINIVLERHSSKLDNRLDRLEERLLETRRP